MEQHFPLTKNAILYENNIYMKIKGCCHTFFGSSSQLGKYAVTAYLYIKI